MGCLLDALARAYDVLGFGQASGGDEVFAQLVLARIIEPVSKADSLRVLEEAGLAGPSYATLKRRLPVYAKEAWRQKISAACAAHAGLGPASLVLYDVSTLYFETDEGDGFRESGLFEGAAAGAADHHRPAHRPGRLPAHGVGVRGKQGRDQDHAPGHRGVHGRARPPGRHGRRGRGDGARGESEGDRGRGPVVHPGREDPARSPTWSRSGGASTPARTSPTGTCSPSPGRPGRTAAAGTRSSTTSTRPTGPEGRCAASTSRCARPSRPSPARRRSSGTGSSGSPAAPGP